jgi:hypothetical protein
MPAFRDVTDIDRRQAAQFNLIEPQGPPRGAENKVRNDAKDEQARYRSHNQAVGRPYSR